MKNDIRPQVLGSRVDRKMKFHFGTKKKRLKRNQSPHPKRNLRHCFLFFFFVVSFFFSSSFFLLVAITKLPLPEKNERKKKPNQIQSKKKKANRPIKTTANRRRPNSKATTATTFDGAQKNWDPKFNVRPPFIGRQSKNKKKRNWTKKNVKEKRRPLMNGRMEFLDIGEKKKWIFFLEIFSAQWWMSLRPAMSLAGDQSRETTHTHLQRGAYIQMKRWDSSRLGSTR